MIEQKSRKAKNEDVWYHEQSRIEVNPSVEQVEFEFGFCHSFCGDILGLLNVVFRFKHIVLQDW